MIKSLSIQNYVLIQQLSIDFASGFTVITGETGAGKSVLLGAIGLLAGNRADHGVLLEQDKKCIIEGQFSLNSPEFQTFFTDNELDFDDPVIIRREISPGGKSRAFINDTPIQLSILKDIGDRILNIHSQHETLLISGNKFQLQVLDSFCGHFADVTSFQKLYEELQSISGEIESLENRIAQKATEADYLRFLHQELENAQLSEEEYHHLEQDEKTLQHAEKIGECLAFAIDQLTENEVNIRALLSRTAAKLEEASTFLPQLTDFSMRLKESAIEIADVSQGLSSLTDKAEVNPDRLLQISKRIDEYQRLFHKHKVSNAASLLDIFMKLGENIENDSLLETKLDQLKLEQSKIVGTMEQLADQLHKTRQKHAPVFQKSVKELLSQLGMPDAIFEVPVEKSEQFRPDGKNHIRFLFNANKGGKPQELGSVISGGEMSRVMLAIKTMTAQRNLLPTIIFDEIDSGVSGETAAKMGTILKKLAAEHQVIAITHLPQIAARGDKHLHVTKTDAGNRMQTMIEEIDTPSRIEVIARMMSDEKLSASAMEMAKELLFN